MGLLQAGKSEHPTPHLEPHPGANHTQLLYDFGCESSAITKAQGALLLAQSHLIPRPLAGNTPFGSIWLSVAIHFARDANAHRYASYMASAPLDVARARKQQNTLKRLWWCCVICDRVFPLSSRRDIKITKSNFDFAGCPVLESGDLADETYTSDVYDPTTKTILAEVLQKFVELCVVLTDVLTVTSVLHSHPSWDSTINADKLNSSKEDIQQWFCSWSQTKSTIEERSHKEGLAGSSNASVTMTTKLLDMYY
ncbi:fungal specific transcription factor domain-containing protein [Candidatus Bathyarchaeota archaeon]|nr:fungal specific transcription factor domain-containing protein [Candidatus Bathyarchaeota archaeon]